MNERKTYRTEEEKRSITNRLNRIEGQIRGINRMILEELCERVLWMEKGKIVKIGNVKEVMDEYEEYMHQ